MTRFSETRSQPLFSLVDSCLSWAFYFIGELMALKDQPYLPLFIQDLLTDEKLIECSPEAHGVYFRLICLLHKQEVYGKLELKAKYKQISSKIEAFATMLSKQMPFSKDEIDNGISELKQEGVIQIEDFCLSQKRMVRDGEKSLKKATAGSLGGKAESKSQADIKQKSSKSQADTESESESENKDVPINIDETEIEPWYLEQADFWIDRAKKYFPSVERDRIKFAKDIEKLIKIDKLKIEEVILIQDYLAEKPDTNGFNWFKQIGTPGKLRDRSKNADKIKYWELILKDIFEEKEKSKPKWAKTYREANLINQEKIKNEQK